MGDSDMQTLSDELETHRRCLWRGTSFTQTPHFPAPHPVSLESPTSPSERFPFACPGALQGPQSRSLICFLWRQVGRNGGSKGLLKALRDLGCTFHAG